jgi:hypothetical protein
VLIQIPYSHHQYFRQIQLQYLQKVFTALPKQSPTMGNVRQDILFILLPKDYSSPNFKALLKEITMLLQVVFLNVKEQSFGSSYPALASILDIMKTKTEHKPVTKGIYTKELSGYGILSDYMLSLDGDSSSVKLVSQHIANMNDTRSGIPLIVLSIKMIQLINRVLHDKIGLSETCEIEIPELSVGLGATK